jgi:hypothetical protein
MSWLSGDFGCPDCDGKRSPSAPARQLRHHEDRRRRVIVLVVRHSAQSLRTAIRSSAGKDATDTRYGLLSEASGAWTASLWCWHGCGRSGMITPRAVDGYEDLGCGTTVSERGHTA